MSSIHAHLVTTGRLYPSLTKKFQYWQRPNRGIFVSNVLIEHVKTVMALLHLLSQIITRM